MQQARQGLRATWFVQDSYMLTTCGWPLPVSEVPSVKPHHASFGFSDMFLGNGSRLHSGVGWRAQEEEGRGVGWASFQSWLERGPAPLLLWEAEPVSLTRKTDNEKEKTF